MESLIQITIKSPPILGMFSKATKGAKAFNYGSSAGPDCDKCCPHHPESISAHAKSADTLCYAWKVERRHDRQQLQNKLHRHQLTNREHLTALAMAEVDKIKSVIPWFRFSAFGSVPSLPPSNFRQLCQLLEQRNTPLHLPVESVAKTLRYRKELKGLKVAVRRSCGSVRSFVRSSIRANPLSVVAGTMQQSPSDRIVESKRVAAMRTKRTKRKTVVCPAVATIMTGNRSSKAKCGNCVACANPDIDIVYPVHK